MISNIIIDTDIGDDIDDAMAIAFASMCPKINILGITTTFWQPERRRQLVLSFLRELGFPKISCYNGASSAIGGDIWDGGEDEKYWGNQFPFFERRNDLFAESKNGCASDYIIKEATKSNLPLTLLGIGPATNFAIALQKKPEIKEKIDRIVMMGGNVINGEMAEYNLNRDIKAYEILLDSGIPLTLAPIEVTKNLCFKNLYLELIHSGKAGKVLNELYQYWKPFKRDKTDAILYDLAAVMLLTHPEIFKISEKRLELDRKKGVLFASTSGVPVKYIEEIDHQAFFDCFIKTIRSIHV